MCRCMSFQGVPHRFSLRLSQQAAGHGRPTGSSHTASLVLPASVLAPALNCIFPLCSWRSPPAPPPIYQALTWYFAWDVWFHCLPRQRGKRATQSASHLCPALAYPPSAKRGSELGWRVDKGPWARKEVKLEVGRLQGTSTDHDDC